MATMPIVMIPLVTESPRMAERGKTPAVKKHAPTFYFIMADKLIKGAPSLLPAVGVYKMAGAQLPDTFDRVARHVHHDPENRFLTDVGDLIDQIRPATMRRAATGTLLCSMFSLVGGFGLIFRAPWAGRLTMGESGFLLPVEILELIRHCRFIDRRPELLSQRRPGLLAVPACNGLIVGYLYTDRKRLFHHRHRLSRASAPPIYEQSELDR